MKIPEVIPEKYVVGTDTPRMDGYAKVTGKQEYSSDISYPDMMWAVVIRSPFPHAEIVSIDTSEAEAFGAVVLTSKDTNPYLYNERSVSVPNATFRDRRLLPTDKVRHYGEPVMALAHDTEALAHKAARLVKIVYRELPYVLDAEEAMKDGAPQLFDKIYLGDEEVLVHNNKGVIRNIDEGNVDKGFAEADHIYEAHYVLDRIYHNQLETKSAVCKPEPDGSMTVWCTTQSIHGTRSLIAKLLDLPFSKVNIKKVTLGGGFGSSIQMNTVIPICAALAKKSGRPVKLLSSREEDFYSHHKYPTTFDIKLGVTSDMMITAAEVKALVDFGSHQIQPLAYIGCTAGWFASLYKYGSNIRFNGTAVYTNKVPCCAMQGYGNPQINFAIESMIDDICNEHGWDPIEFRLKNYRTVGDEFWGQGPTIRSIIKTSGVKESLIEGGELFNWKERKPHTEKTGRYRKGIGVARGFHTSGTGGPKEGEVIDYSSAYIKINEDGSVDVVSPVMDHGGGTWDALAKICADVLQVPLNKVGMSPTDTRTTGFDICTHATRGVYCGGAAVEHVALKVREKLLEVAGRIMNEDPKRLSIYRDDELGQGVVYLIGFPDKRMTIEQIAFHAKNYSWGTIAYADSYRQKNCPPCFVTHFVEVEVDTLTGDINMTKALMYGDCGTAINPKLLEGQLIGSFNRGLGYTLYEHIDYDNKTGQLKNRAMMVDYKTPTFCEMPYVKDCMVRVCDVYEPTGPFGAKGIGEAALASVAASIGNAIYNAVGIRFTSIPITPEKMLKALKEKEENA
ncbi:MAG: xanthine dehydrogenase family protein molybdopterin-binding subunit [Clostridia bacterium]|nr:xanthine dehydrogenase family protein molybdopterin-binding subunit [Clostridia bacterium]